MILVAAGWAPGTESENETRKPTQPTPTPAVIHPTTTSTPQNRRIPRISPTPRRPAARAPATQPPEPADRTGNHTMKSEPVHNCTRCHSTANQGDTVKPRNPNNPLTPSQSITPGP
ncbi:hypothetical protein THER5_1917 [Bifidobacterium thermacidophilum subsp. thermacidophilum]|uniref:Uncharacterized protein n=1 Tax=Bifidobacterium thermacidophilum subsp. thermacidophilum TaxID=79262 RepID=A0A087E302_9BIFI|nr:hypothetical protein THER5_1917 [Bifidobacterium thermacidophilum subsp. thermacidophilum]